MKIQVKDLHKFYGSGENKAEVLKGVQCEIKAGEICSILGPSGSGKSTLLNIIGGIETFEKGVVNIDTVNIGQLSPKALANYRRVKLGFIFQFYNLIGNLTIKENIEVGAYLSKYALDINEILDVLGLTKHQNKFPYQLSGGQQQRTGIGRALIKNPDILLCDELTGALDYSTSKEVLGLIQDINEKYRTTILIVTHNEAITRMSHRNMYLHDGLIIRSAENANPSRAIDLEW